MGDDTPGGVRALRVDEAKLIGHVGEVVRSSVEETLNRMYDANADKIRRAQDYEHSAEGLVAEPALREEASHLGGWNEAAGAEVAVLALRIGTY